MLEIEQWVTLAIASVPWQPHCDDNTPEVTGHLLLSFTKRQLQSF